MSDRADQIIVRLNDVDAEIATILALVQSLQKKSQKMRLAYLEQQEKFVVVEPKNKYGLPFGQVPSKEKK